MMMENANEDDSIPEPEVKIEKENKEALLLTFESVINEVNEGLMPNETLIENEELVPTVSELPIRNTHNYMCKVCHLVFKSSKTLRMHQRRKHKSFRKNFIHICDYCGMSYETKNSLVAHIKRKHGPNSIPEDFEERTCDICALVFKGMARLRMHMRRKHGSFKDSFKHVCEECGLTYEKHRSLIVHKKRKHSKIMQPRLNQWYHCLFCPKIFTKRETYVRHVQRKHKISEEETMNTIKEKNLTAEYLESCINSETGEITCKECPLVFSSLNYLKLHMRRKHNALREAFRLKCKVCNLSYDRVESLKRHVRRKHDNSTYCNYCKKNFDTREAYISHSHVKSIRECSICGLIFASNGGLGKHLRCAHKVEGQKTVFCKICNEGFNDKKHLRPHILRVHLKMAFTCNFCTKIFKSKESFRKHVMLKHKAENPFESQTQTCESCNKVFKDEFELSKHFNLEHNSSTKSENFTVPKLLEIKKEEEEVRTSFQCTKCPEEYDSWENLKVHFEQNHRLFEDTQCQICGELVRGNELEKHIKNHNVLEEIQCRYCEFKTNQRVSLTQHMLRHKNATTLNCTFPLCKYKTFYEDAMMKHRRKHEDQGVKLQCTQCPFQTMNKYILKYHEEAHATGKKRYKCDQCDYATILPANLVQHKYKHSSEKRFKCEVCPFATKYNTSLRFHVKKKHCDLPTFS